MNRNEKKNIIESISKSFSECEAAFILSCPDLNVEKTQDLKRKLYSINGKMIFAKNTLLKLAAKENDSMGAIADCFTKKIAIVFAFKNASGVAAAIKSSGYGKDIAFNAGIFLKKSLSVSKFEFLSNIPSDKILKSNVCGVLKMPMVKLVYVLSKIIEKENIS